MESKLKVGVITLFLLAAALVVYSFAKAAVVSHTPGQISPQGAGSGLDADQLQGLSLPALKLAIGWTTSGANIITTAAGNVGIGIPAPLQKLHVNGYTRADTGLCIGTDCITSWSQVAGTKTFASALARVQPYDYADSVAEASDGSGYVVAGTISGIGGIAADLPSLAKVDVNGAKVWQNIYNSVGGSAKSVANTSDGGYIVGGRYYHDSTWDGFLFKTDSNGNLQWNKAYSGAVNDERLINSVIPVSGGYVFAGGKQTSCCSKSFWLAKTDSNGNILWEKTWFYGFSYGGQAYSVAQLSDGGYVLVGYTDDSNTIPNVWIIKTDSSGNKLQDLIINGNNFGLIDQTEIARSVVATADGSFVLAGDYFSSGIPARRPWLVKGFGLWIRLYSGGYSNNASAYSVAQSSDGGYIVSGTAYSTPTGSDDFWLLKTDSNGNKVWEKIYGETRYDSARSVIKTSDSGYLMGGYEYQTNFNNMYMVKVDSQGRLYRGS